MTDLTLTPRKAELFWAKVSIGGPDECWPWTGATTAGYGRFGLTRRASVRAHRVSYENIVGPIPPGLVLDHLCRNRACVNPAHLEPVTNAVNVLRGEGYSATNARASHCPRGHAYDEANTYRWRGQRRCRACHDIRQRSHRRAA